MNYEIYTMLGVGLIIILLIIWVITLERKLKKLLMSKNGSIDDTISSLRKDTDDLKKYAIKTSEKLQIVDKKLRKTVSGNETVRFNPFKGDGSGSNQSFATALMNNDGDGVVISTIYSRDHISIFSKPVKNMNSEYELTEEERTAIQKAKDSII